MPTTLKDVQGDLNVPLSRCRDLTRKLLRANEWVVASMQKRKLRPGQRLTCCKFGQEGHF
ncbi:hypothetical protein GCM10007385_31670 [Tateyamaria omphalii]|nr:hypothetical protein [Tateyamaria omphalii]GGX60085.1 hypothetical protein GCM10007385_31670 [Tateyamaria omphalii]